MNFGLKGRRVIITGAAQGIGEACTQWLAREGAAVALWDVQDAAGQSAARAITESGGRALYCHCDVSCKAEVDAALEATVDAFATVDGLVSNAGIFRAADFLEVQEADWDAVIGVNLKGAFLVGQAVARVMCGNRDGAGFGAIVHMSSVNGQMAIPSIASYNASKGGLDQLTRAMALALADRHIRVNAVGPGTIATELSRSAVLTSDEARQRILGRTPLRRLGEPREVAQAVAFLLSEASSYITGEILYIDGGRRALNYTVPL